MKILLDKELIRHTSLQDEVEVSGTTVVDALEDLFNKFPQFLVFLTVHKGMEAEKTSIRLNGEYLFDPKDLHRVVCAEDIIEFGRDVPEGEKGGLQIVVGAVLIAASIMTAGGAAMGFWAQMGATMGAGMVLGGVTSLIVGSPKLPTFDSGNSTSATYTFSGIKNTTVSGTPIPIVYGRHRVGGHVLNAYVDVLGQYSYLYALLGIASGPINQIDPHTIEINERNQDNFQDLAFYWRKGSQFNLPPAGNPLIQPQEVVFKEDISPSSFVDSWHTLLLPNGGDVDQINFRLQHKSYLIARTFLLERWVGKLRVYKQDEITLLYEADVSPTGWTRSGGAGVTVGYLPTTVNFGELQAGNFIVKAQVFQNDFSSSNPPTTPSTTPLEELKILEYVNTNAEDTTLDTLAVMKGFNQLIPDEDPDNQNIGAIVSTETPVETVKIRLSAPGFYSGNGTLGATVQFKVYTRQSNASTWSLYDFTANKEPGVEDTDWSYFKTGKPSKTEVSIARTITLPSIDYYDIKIVRVTPRHASDITIADDIYLADLIEISSEGLAYPWVALLGARIRATDQLRDSFPTITSIIEGSCVSLPTGYVSKYENGRSIRYWETPWDGTMSTDSDPDNVIWTDSPIWCLWDLLTNPIHGLNEHFSIKPEKKNLVLANLVAMSAYCDQYLYENGTVAASPNEVDADDVFPRIRYSLNLVIDQSKSAREWVNVICASMNALLFQADGMVYLDVDQPKNITQIFNMSNIKDYSQSCASLRAIPNTYEVSFYNKDKDYDQDSFLIETPEYQASELTTEERKQTMSYIGVTDERQVRNLLFRTMNVASNTGTLVSFKTGTEGLMSTVFSVVGVQHDVPQWGSGGLVQEVEDAGSSWLVTLSDSFIYTLLEGDNLWGQLAISISNEGKVPVEIGVVEPGVNGTYSEVNISKTYVDSEGATQNFTPEVGATYILGQVTNTVKPFKILNLKRDSDELTEVTAVEYLEDAYSDDITNMPVVAMPSFSQLPPVDKSSVTSVVAEETIYVDTTGNLKTGATVYYAVQSNLLWAGCIVYYGIAGNYSLTPVDKTGIVFIPEISEEGDYDFICISLYSDGTRQTVADALVDPKQPYTSLHLTPYVENTEFLKGVSGLQLVGQGNDSEFVGKDAKFTWKRPSATDFGLNDIASDNPLGVQNADSWLREYRVEIKDSSGNLLRTAKTFDESYVYTYEQNYSDSGTLPHRSFSIGITAVDRLGRSSKTSTLTVSNPAPPAVT